MAVSAAASNSAIGINASMDASFLRKPEPRLVTLGPLPDALLDEEVLGQNLGLGVGQLGEDGFVDLRLTVVRELGRLPAELLEAFSDHLPRAWVELDDLLFGEGLAFDVALLLVVDLGDEDGADDLGREAGLELLRDLQPLLDQQAVEGGCLSLVEGEAVALLAGDNLRKGMLKLDGLGGVLLGQDALVERGSDANVLLAVRLHLRVPERPRVEPLSLHHLGIVALPLLQADAPGFEAVGTSELAEGVAVLTSRCRVDLSEVGPDEAGEDEGVGDHPLRLPVRVNELHGWDVVLDDVVADDLGSVFELLETPGQGAGVDGPSGHVAASLCWVLPVVVVAGVDDTRVHVLENERVDAVHRVEQTIALDVEDVAATSRTLEHRRNPAIGLTVVGFGHDCPLSGEAKKAPSRGTGGSGGAGVWEGG